MGTAWRSTLQIRNMEAATRGSAIGTCTLASWEQNTPLALKIRDGPEFANSHAATLDVQPTHIVGASAVAGGLMRSMFKVGPLIAAAVIIVGCGSNNSMIRVSPAVADAKNYPGGVVPFSAGGTSQLTWCIGTTNGVCNGNIASPAVIDSAGHAQCIQGQSATVTVLAGTGAKVGLPDGGEQLSSFGTAELTCP